MPHEFRRLTGKCRRSGMNGIGRLVRASQSSRTATAPGRIISPGDEESTLRECQVASLGATHIAPFLLKADSRQPKIEIQREVGLP